MYIVSDVGSTNTRIAASTDLLTFSEPVIVDTPKNYEEGLDLITESAHTLANGAHIDGVQIGLPARLSIDRRSIFKVRYLEDWNGKTICDDLSARLSSPVSLENDTMQVGLGEAVFGAGKGSSIVVYMTVSTGVNAVRVVDGVIEPSVYGYETGFQYLSVDAKPVDLMDLISGTSITARFGKSPKDITKDDPIWEELARYTAFGLHNTMIHWSPNIIVLGGSMFNDVGISIDRVAFHLKEINKVFPTLPEIVHSSLGSVGGLWGGLARLKQLHG